MNYIITGIIYTILTICYMWYMSKTPKYDGNATALLFFIPGMIILLAIRDLVFYICNIPKYK